MNQTRSSVRGILSNIVKRTVSVVAAAALLTAGLPPLTTSAAEPFITKNNDGSISIKSKQITTKFIKPSAKEYYDPVMKINNCYESRYDVKVEPGTRMKLTLKLSNLDESSVLYRDKNGIHPTIRLKITSVSDKNDIYDIQTVKPKIEIGEEKGTTCYTLTFTFNCFGEYFYFKTIDPVKYAKGDTPKTARVYLLDSLLSVDTGAYIVKADAPGDNEDFLASVAKVDNASDNSYRSWAKNMCVFINSLSNMTDIKKKTIFYESDGTGGCDNNRLDSGYFEKYALASIGSGTNAFKSYLQCWNDNAPVINIEELHEISHSYSIQYVPCNPNDTYLPGYSSYWTKPDPKKEKYYRRNDFCDFYDMNDDDIFTNARGIAAIQHCQELRKVNLVDAGAKSNTSISGTYTTFLRKYTDNINAKSSWYKDVKNHPQYNYRSGFGYNNPNDAKCHWFNKVLVDLAVESGNWNALKEFFRGGAPDNWNDHGPYDAFCDYVGMPREYYKDINLEYSRHTGYADVLYEHRVKIVNTTYRLFRLFNPVVKQFDKNKYTAFLNKYFNDYNYNGTGATYGQAILKSFIQRINYSDGKP